MQAENTVLKTPRPLNEKLLRRYMYKVVHLVGSTHRADVYEMHSKKCFVYLGNKNIEVIPKTNRYGNTIFVDRQFFERVQTGDLQLF